ncbi:hypothetical protein SAMN05216578_1141 [Halopseudomonas formosensis]|uniref:Uncharacterized protein n=1 Tax=Halopseudomonas formosensis TaxID=1002526 RepID=A0A1I6C631_9GAMM|nr:hypothetical protein SAMN05216578_1141 [Halopseudomonas formosensis]
MRMVLENLKDYPSEWAAIESIAPKIGCVPQTLSLFNGALGQVRVNAANRCLKICQQQHLPVIGPFRGVTVRCKVWPRGDLPATLGEPLQALLFQLIFRHASFLFPFTSDIGRLFQQQEMLNQPDHQGFLTRQAFRHQQRQGHQGVVINQLFYRPRQQSGVAAQIP